MENDRPRFLPGAATSERIYPERQKVRTDTSVSFLPLDLTPPPLTPFTLGFVTQL